MLIRLSVRVQEVANYTNVIYLCVVMLLMHTLVAYSVSVCKVATMCVPFIMQGLS